MQKREMINIRDRQLTRNICSPQPRATASGTSAKHEIINIRDNHWHWTYTSAHPLLELPWPSSLAGNGIGAAGANAMKDAARMKATGSLIWNMLKMNKEMMDCDQRKKLIV